jgi:hypothetical protein
VAQREPARIRLLGANHLHASGEMSQRAVASQARASANYLAGVWVSRAEARLHHDLDVIGSPRTGTRCKPASDSEGVEILAGYLRRMRGQEPPLRAGMGLVRPTSE